MHKRGSIVEVTIIATRRWTKNASGERDPHVNGHRKWIHRHVGTSPEVARLRGRVNAVKDGRGKRALERIKRRQARIRAKVEHSFRLVKCQFSLPKVGLRRPAKNAAHVITVFARTNLWTARLGLWAMTTGAVCPEMAK